LLTLHIISEYFWVLAFGSQQKGSDVPYLKSLLVNKDRIRPGGDFPWLGSMLPFHALTLLVG